MRLTKHGHSCVALEKDGRRIVIDPGVLTAEDAVAGAEAILITHEHADHFVEQVVRDACERDPRVTVYANAAVADQLGGLGPRLREVGEGDTFEVAGFSVQVHGQWHAVVHPDIPRVTNIGYLFDGGAFFHPGDALTVPATPVDTLLLPVNAPWSKAAELIDWVREVNPHRSLAIHDGMINGAGLALVARLFGESGLPRAPYTRLTPGESLTT
jgi:L-ascorbate metabolism protein UlaG (beta-lactamase superfamily)